MGNIIPFPFRLPQSAESSCVYFTITDDSLDYGESPIPCGTVLECKTGAVEYGNLHAIRIADGKYYIRYLKAVGNKELELSATHPSFPPIRFPKSRVEILGVITSLVSMGQAKHAPNLNLPVLVLNPEAPGRYKIEPANPALPNVIYWQLNEMGACLSVTDNWLALTSVSYEELFEGWGYLKMIFPEDRERAIQNWYKSLTTGRPYYQEYRVPHPSGHLRRCVAAAARHMHGPDNLVWLGSCFLFP